MTPSGLYSVNENDWFDTYGFVVQKVSGKGKDAFLKFPDAKQPALSKDWPDQNGTEYDLSQRFFKEKEIQIDGVLVANSYDEFWERHQAMFVLFSQPGTLRMYVNSLQRSFYIFYDSCADFGTITKLTGDYTGMIGCSYSFKFIEPVPSFWQPFNFLIDENSNYFTDGDENKFLMNV